MPVEQQFGYGYAMGAFSKALFDDVPTVDRFIGIVTDGLLAGQLDAGQVERLVAASSASRDEYVAMFVGGDDNDHLLWDRTPFERRPFFRVGDGRVLLLSPRFLHSWMGEGVYYRLLDAAMRRPNPSRPERPATLRFTQFHGELMERYVQRVAERSHADQLRAGVVQISPEQIYRGKRGTQQKSPDLMLSYATDLVAIEVTGGRPSHRTRVLSDPSLMEKELDDRVIGKLEELDRALVDVLDGTVRDPRRSTRSHRTRLAATHRSSHNHPERPFVEPTSRPSHPRSLRHHPALQRPTLFSIEDFEHALAAVENGAGLPQILGTRLGSRYRRMPPSHFFQHHFQTDRRPAYVDEQLRLVFVEAQTALALASSDGA